MQPNQANISSETFLLHLNSDLIDSICPITINTWGWSILMRLNRNQLSSNHHQQKHVCPLQSHGSCPSNQSLFCRSSALSQASTAHVNSHQSLTGQNFSLDRKSVDVVDPCTCFSLWRFYLYYISNSWFPVTAITVPQTQQFLSLINHESTHEERKNTLHIWQKQSVVTTFYHYRAFLYDKGRK